MENDISPILINGITLNAWEDLYSKILYRIRKEYAPKQLKLNDIKNNIKDCSIQSMLSNDPEVQKIIVRKFNLNISDVDEKTIRKYVKSSRKIETLIYNWKRGNQVKDVEDYLFKAYQTYANSKSILNLKVDTYHDNATVKSFSGYYFSYLKNNLAEQKFTLKLSNKTEINKKYLISDSHDFYATQQGFHDEGNNKTEFSGSAYQSGNYLYVTLNTNKEYESGKPVDSIFLILTIGSNWENTNEISGILTAVSKSVKTRPILSMEVLLVKDDSDISLREIMNSFLSLHKYSIRHRVSKDPFKELSIHDSSYNISSAQTLKDTYSTFRFDKDWNFVHSIIKIEENLKTTCHRKTESGKTIIYPCDVKIDRVAKNAYILGIKSYTNLSKRYLAATVRLNWFPKMELEKYKNITGVISTFYEGRHFQSPIILYKDAEWNEPQGKIDMARFKDMIGEKESNRIFKFLTRDVFPNIEILSYLSMNTPQLLVQESNALIMETDKKVELIKISLKFETWLAIKNSKEVNSANQELIDLLDKLKRAAKQKNSRIVVSEGDTETWTINWNYETNWFELNLIGEAS